MSEYPDWKMVRQDDLPPGTVVKGAVWNGEFWIWPATNEACVNLDVLLMFVRGEADAK